VLFSIMASPALPIINPFDTTLSEKLYDDYYEQGNVLRVKLLPIRKNFERYLSIYQLFAGPVQTSHSREAFTKVEWQNV
jgi:hypothetical protein